MAMDIAFSEEEVAIDEGLGYPKAYAKLCWNRGLGPYSHGPPFTFTPYILQQHEALRARELDQMFPIIDPKAKPTTKPKIFISLLWKQLNHLGNAGFDPAIFRVDPYGNVLYYHADSASPLAWDIDHWFPCSRGGLTVPSNLRILQWQVCRRKHNKLEFLVPWHRAFSLLFFEGENEELNDSHTVESHTFPHHFIESKEQVGLAPAAVVLSRRESRDPSPALKSLDFNRQPRPNSPIVAARKMKHSVSKENENPDMVTNPYQAIVMARDSLKQREEAAKMQGEIQKLDDEVNDLKQKNEEEKVLIQDLEYQLIKRRRRAEKCRRLAEAQSSYRIMLEKMIRDAMHQSVIYKEQVRLNQAATNALMARLEAQKAICDASEKELHKKFKQRDEIEYQIRPEWEQGRKRSRMDDTLHEDGDNKTVLCLPGIKPSSALSHKELRVFLEEEQKASEAALSLIEERKQEEIEEEPAENVNSREKPEETRLSIVAVEDENTIEERLQALEIGEGKNYNTQFPVLREPEIEEDEECRKQRGKGNVEKWLQMLLENTQEEGFGSNNAQEHETSRTDEVIRQLNLKYPYNQTKFPESENKQQKIRGGKINKSYADGVVGSIGKGVGSSMSFEGKERRGERSRKDRGLVRSESARTFRPTPSSPSVILTMKKGVDCIGKKPMVTGDDEDEEDGVVHKNFLKSSIKTIKKVVKM
ncbi:hypothetical protein CK203_047769 [Vitis vinifera]|uniref:Uncharacterized protein n=1 Tax=Vitis vinifera TaxID=29760 RepID=A0A438GXY3_VITVI|nr:hypothetical protein CK203_047769 [Vitis vinifera]